MTAEKTKIEENSSLIKALLWLPQKLTALNARVEKMKGKAPEIIVLCLFCVLKALMGVFHEPWFDEAVAWQIAREASFKDILLSVPHYEGHPPLWHLVLAPFAKLGAPYELSLVLVSLLFMGLAVFLLLWYAPFPRLVKWAIPFTYFCFYQYAVISRPYCMTALAFVLCALSYETRNKKPWRYVLSLAFLCLTSAFGIAIAGGLALAWVIEILREKPLSATLKGMFKDRRVWTLFALLALAVLLVLEIVPAEDAFAVINREATRSSSVAAGFLYLVFCMPTDVFLASVGGYGFLFSTELDFASLAAPGFLGLIVWFLVGRLAYKKGRLCTFILPSFFFAVLAAVTYMCKHHTGVFFWFILFFVWIVWNAPEVRPTNATVEKGIVALATVLVAFSLCVSMFWSISTSVIDVKKQYASGRAMASFIKEHHLDEYRIMVGWKNEEEISDINLTEAAELMPYFDHNIFFNFMGGDDHQNYITHHFASEEETKAAFAQWREGGLPDVLLYDAAAGTVFGDEFDLRDYAVVFSTVSGKIWKGGETAMSTYVYVRRELLPELGLTELTAEEILAIDRQ